MELVPTQEPCYHLLHKTEDFAVEAESAVVGSIAVVESGVADLVVVGSLAVVEPVVTESHVVGSLAVVVK